MTDDSRALALNSLADDIAAINERNGFWRTDLEHHVQIPVKLALVAAEVSEALEVNRLDRSNEPGERVVGMSEPQAEDFVEELADVVIRVLDIAGYYGLDLGSALVAKVEKNKTRPFKHGKKY